MDQLRIYCSGLTGKRLLIVIRDKGHVPPITKEELRGLLRRRFPQNALQPLGNSFPLEDPVAAFKHRHLPKGFTQIIIVEDPDIGQSEDGGLEVRQGPW